MQQMKKTNLLVFAVLIVLASGCGQDNGKIFNGKDLSNWNFVVENDAVPGDRVYTVKDGQIAIKGENEKSAHPMGGRRD